MAPGSASAHPVMLTLGQSELVGRIDPLILCAVLVGNECGCRCVHPPDSLVARPRSPPSHAGAFERERRKEPLATPVALSAEVLTVVRGVRGRAARRCASWTTSGLSAKTRKAKRRASPIEQH